MEKRGDEVNSLFHELREIHADMTQMGVQVNSIRQVSFCSSNSSSSSSNNYAPLHSSQTKRRRSPLNPRSRPSPYPCRISTCKKQLSLIDEDELADVSYRVLKKICELSLDRVQGLDEIPLIV